jgi:hypothetical protein
MEQQGEIRIMLSHVANYHLAGAMCKRKLRHSAKFSARAHGAARSSPMLLTACRQEQAAPVARHVRRPFHFDG